MTEGSILAAEGLCAGYGNWPAVVDLNLEIGRGEMVLLLGPNGAGKTTTLLALAGECRPSAGCVVWHGKSWTAPLHKRARDGLCFVTEERSVIMSLSVHDNLKLGRGPVERALEVFPELRPRLKTRAGQLSGGE